jgi:hypothetical protein
MTADKIMLLEDARKRFPPIWVVCDRPRDYPDHFVVRVWFGLVPEPRCWLFESLQQAREHVVLDGASVRMGRAPTDDQTIVETWL